MSPKVVRAASGAVPRPEIGYAVMSRCNAALDGAAFAHARDGYERAEMVHLAIRATGRRSDLTLITGERGRDPYKIAYYAVKQGRPPLRFLSGVILAAGEAAAVERAAAALADIETFDLARLDLPRFRKSNGIWTMRVRRAKGGSLLLFGFPRRTREILPLAETYELFLSALGKHTRRNLRSCRKKGDEAAVAFASFDERPPTAFFAKLFALAAKNGPTAISRQLVAEKEGNVARQERQFYTTLTSREGALISLCRGFIWESCAVVCYQLNDRDHFDKNPSLLHRAHLMEWLIGRGVREVIFLDGCAGLLRNAALPDAGSAAVTVRASAAALAKAMLFPLLRAGMALGYLVSLLPERLRRWLHVGEP